MCKWKMMVDICQKVLKSFKAPPTIPEKADPQISSASQVSRFRNKIYFRGIRVPLEKNGPH